MLVDAVDFVRQSGFIALALVYQQNNETQSPKVKKQQHQLVIII